MASPPLKKNSLPPAEGSENRNRRDSRSSVVNHKLPETGNFLEHLSASASLPGREIRRRKKRLKAQITILRHRIAGMIAEQAAYDCQLQLRRKGAGQ